MSSHIVIDGNAFYEVDDACMREKEKERERLRKVGKKKKRSSGSTEMGTECSPVP